MKWLRDLLANIEAFPDKDIKNQEPDTEVGDDEKVIGTIPVGLRKLLAYRGVLIDEFKDLKEAHEKEHKGSGHTEKMCDEFGNSATRLKDEIEVTGTAFWRELRNELKITADSIGVRKGWKVVETPEEEEEPGIRVIGMGMGMSSLRELLSRAGR
ncbi:hypothetical protein HY967_01685 [Candidatus Jorgensenbacteria bacterium]|nr:hypothetical protein [Candidatus Jorgensenbacteria bacterium]